MILNSTAILSNNLTGIYLHGSAVMGCFNDKKINSNLLNSYREIDRGFVKG